MSAIFQNSADDVEWGTYKDSGIRYKGLTTGKDGVPGVGYIEYPAGYSDSVHSHNVDELMLIVAGELAVDGASQGPGGVIFVPANTDYALKAGPAGATYFRVVA